MREFIFFDRFNDCIDILNVPGTSYDLDEEIITKALSIEDGEATLNGETVSRVLILNHPSGTFYSRDVSVRVTEDIILK